MIPLDSGISLDFNLFLSHRRMMTSFVDASFQKLTHTNSIVINKNIISPTLSLAFYFRGDPE